MIAIENNTLSKDSILLELAMSYDQSVDAKKNATSFLSVLSKIFNLSFVGIWQRDYELSDSYTPAYVYPNDIKCALIQGTKYLNHLLEKDFIITSNQEEIGKELLQLRYTNEGNLLIFNTPFALFYLHRLEVPFKEEEGNLLNNQIVRFSNFLLSKHKYNLISEKLAAHEITAKSDHLQKSNARYAIMFQNMEEGVLIYNYKKEKIIDCNNSAIKLFEYPNKEELLKINRFTFIPQFSPFFPNMDLHEYTRGHGVKVMNGEGVERTLGIFSRKDNTHFLVDANIVPTFQEEGEAFIIFKNSTDKVLAKKELKSREKKYHQIFEYSHEGIIYFDIKNQKIIDCNTQALKLFEIEDKDVFLQSDFSTFFSRKENEISAIEFYEKEISLAIKNGNSSFTHKAQTFYKNPFIAESNIIVDKGKLVCFIRNITEQFNSRNKLKQQHHKLQKYIASNMQLENFAYIASHDLKTPLSNILCYTQLLQKNLKDRASDLEFGYIDFVIESAKDMQYSIQGLFNYSLISNKEIKPQEIHVKELLQKTTSELYNTIEKKKAQLNFKNIPERIFADPYGIKSLFKNILLNALKFSKENIHPIINIDCSENNTHWNFSIADNGIGIESQYQEKIFLLFKQLYTKDEYKGSGIGLATCKKIVEQHNGEIWMESKLEEGSTFHFTLSKTLNKEG